LYFNDFEAYNVGDFLAVVDPTHWTTWSGAPGGPEDAPIVDDQAYSGTKSVQVTGATTDAVFLINDLTSGHYTIHFMTYVVSGNNGYFNVLQDFNGTSSLWGIEVFFDAAGVGTVNAGGTGTATFSYSYDTWFLSELKVNLDTDWAQLFIDGNLVIEYVWSTGATGTQTLNALGGVDMYAWTVNGPCNYYFDDFTFDEVGGVTLDPPTDLEADVTGNDVHLTWVAPGGGGTIEELIYDNGTNTGAYSYQGYTMSTQMSPSGPCQVLKMKFWTSIQAGDNTFNATLFEWAGSQPSTTIDYEELVTAADDDWMEVDISAQNITYSGDFVVGFGSINATTFLGYDANLNNGRSWDFNNGSPSWAPWNEAYLERAIVQYADGTIAEIGGGLAEPIILKGSVPQLSHPTDYSGVETVKPIGNLSDGLLGYNVYRDGNKINASMVTALEYDDMDLPVGYYEYYVTAVYDEGESGPSNKVYVDIITGIEQPGVINTVIFPNPAREMIHITSATEMSAVRIYNYAGQLVLDTRATGTTCRIDASVLTGGIYIIQVENGDGIHTERIIIE
ncbi:MAG: T9SS type A sorting domain-containing protein, partial [Bacteroidales bacterium]|nr:T9SS type A sorting domain-containing protein [Bacteroidales bacterium]